MPSLKTLAFSAAILFASMHAQEVIEVDLIDDLALEFDDAILATELFLDESLPELGITIDGCSSDDFHLAQDDNINAISGLLSQWSDGAEIVEEDLKSAHKASKQINRWTRKCLI